MEDFKIKRGGGIPRELPKKLQPDDPKKKRDGKEPIITQGPDTVTISDGALLKEKKLKEEGR